MRRAVILILWVFLFSSTAEARNVSYVGGWTFLEEFNDDSVYGLVHDTLDPKWSLGFRQEYFRKNEWHYSALQLNHLAKRWNFTDAQANIYLLTSAGAAYQSGRERAAASAGLAADWENRRLFVSYENRYVNAGAFDELWTQKGRVGVAPYVAEAGALHTWLMVEAGYSENREDALTITPLVRFFKSSVMVEVGSTIGGGPMANLRLLF